MRDVGTPNKRSDVEVPTFTISPLYGPWRSKWVKTKMAVGSFLYRIALVKLDV